jgi:hypothetical protein
MSTTTSPNSITEPRWLTYTKAALFASPGAIAWGFACICLVPKAREISQMAGINPLVFGWFWPATFFLVQRGRSILMGAILMLVMLELVAPWWRSRRKFTVGASVWLANVAVLFGLTMLLIIVLMSAPGLAHRQ